MNDMHLTGFQGRKSGTQHSPLSFTTGYPPPQQQQRNITGAEEPMNDMHLTGYKGRKSGTQHSPLSFTTGYPPITGSKRDKRGESFAHPQFTFIYYYMYFIYAYLLQIISNNTK